MKTIHYLIVPTFLVIATVIQAQPSYNYAPKNEFSFGVNFNTNGGTIGGLVFKYGRVVSPRFIPAFSLEVSNVKDPKEIRANGISGGSYLVGKQNYLYVVRPQIGTEIILFNKAPEQGVRIGIVTAFGPSIGFITPYHIFFNTHPDYLNIIDAINVPFDPILHDPFDLEKSARTLAHGSPFDGFGDAQLVVGGNFKLGFSAELGFSDRKMAGIEAGLLTEFYPKKINIIPFSENKDIFTSVYFTLFFGFRS